jgi:phage baseplate assembly protein W
VITINLLENYDYEFAPESVEKEIIQNVRHLLATPEMTVIFNREFGLNFSNLDKPLNIVKTRLIIDINKKIRRYEPRAIIEDIEFQGDAETGYINPIVRISTNG